MCGLTCLKAGPAFQKLPLKRHKSPLKLSGKAFIFTSETTYMEELQPHPKVLATLQVRCFFFSRYLLIQYLHPQTPEKCNQPLIYNVKEIQWRCHVKIPVQFIQDNLLHSANFSWRTTTEAIPSQHLQYWNPLQKPTQRRKERTHHYYKNHRKCFIPALASVSCHMQAKTGLKDTYSGNAKVLRATKKKLPHLPQWSLQQGRSS